MYTDVSTSMDFAEREQGILEFWQETHAMQVCANLRKNAPIYTFFDGPPTANGAPHFGHVITRAVKDLFPRYKTMKGYNVLRKAGWDTHGLPVELEVEKELGISGKPQIEIYGIEPFIKKCKASVLTYEAQWREMSERVGFWADMDEPYVTYHNDYIESVWWALSQMWHKGLIYKSYRVVPYCPRCGTPLSSHEVAQGYKEVTEDSAYVAFKVVDCDEYILAWTTTPWTLPSNVGLCVNANEQYAKVEQGGRVYILAHALVSKLFGEDAHILEVFAGGALVDTKYEPLFPSQHNNENGWRVVADDYVTLSDGTGVVHTAPAFGEDDARVAKAYDLPFVQLVDAQGNFLPDVPIWGGKFVKEADPLIIQELRRRGLLFKKIKTKHNYPFCWRCATPLLYYARDAWFIKMSAMRDKLIEANDTVNWLPENMRRGRFGQWLEGAVDWSLSRERYWGTPLPIWMCERDGCKAQVCVGSIQELASLSEQGLGALELHKPYIDEVFLPCKCGGKMQRTPEVIDCWFDAGSMPFAQWHYPFENKDMFDAHFPADFISEGIDQTRGWFYTLMAISTVLFKKSPYKNVIVTGHGLDEHGQKMSKSLGNVTSYIDALNNHGADALRWFLYAGSQPWQNFKYSPSAVTDISRRFLGTLWNSYAFYVLYAKIDGFNPYEHECESQHVMDRWLISRLNRLAERVDTLLFAYELTEPARLIDQFVDEMSNWYLRLERERFWAGGMESDKICAFKTLHTCLVTLIKLAAPFVPFITEQIYQNLVRGLLPDAPVSVHHCYYPCCNNALVDAELEAQMDTAIQITTLGRAARNLAQIRTRQPLAEALVALTIGRQNLSEEFLAIIRRELNVKHIHLMSDATQYVTYKFKPQLRTLGPRYGAKVPKIAAALNADPTAIANAIKSGTINLEIDGETISLAPDDILTDIMHKDGYFAASDAGITVVLNAVITDELLEEGLVREVKAKLQSMRRDAGFNVTDRIQAGFFDTALADVLNKNSGEIAREILADTLTCAEAPDAAYVQQWSINGNSIRLWVKL